MAVEIQPPTLPMPKQYYRLEEFYNQPRWNSTKAALAYLIHRLDRGDVPDSAGNVGCYASVVYLADHLNKSPRTIARLLAELTDEGALIDLGHTEGSTARRRIFLPHDVRERILARRKVTVVVNGLVVTRRLKKSELPAPVLRSRPDHSTPDMGVTRNESLSEIKNTPFPPSPSEQGDVQLFSFPQSSKPLPASALPNLDPRRASDSSASDVPQAPAPGCQTSQAAADASCATRQMDTAAGLVAAAQEKPRKKSRQEKHRAYRRRLMDMPEVVRFFEGFYDLEKVGDADIAIFMRRWDDGTINLRRLCDARKGLVSRRESEFDLESKRAGLDNTFRSFIVSIDKSCNHAIRTDRRHAISVIKEAMQCLDYPENRSMLDGDGKLDDADFEEIRDAAHYELHYIFKNQVLCLQTEDQVLRFSSILAVPLAKRTFEETRERFFQTEEEQIS